MKKIFHISDIHFGAEDPEIVTKVLEDIACCNPDLVVISGDLTQRAKSAQYEAAADFLSKIEFPQIVVPGNHDISLWNIFRRFFRPLKKYKKYISDNEFPIFEDAEMTVLGINSARSLTIKSGRISLDQIKHIKNIFCDRPEPHFKAVVIHHNLIPSKEVKNHKLLGRAGIFLRELTDCGIDMIFSGHLHQGYSDDVQKFYKDSNSIIIAQAGTATSTRTRKEKNSYNLVEVYPGKITIKVNRFNGAEFFTETEKNFDRISY